MLKALTLLPLALLAASLLAPAAAAQETAAQPPAPAADSWAAVSPAGEAFTVLMPGQPAAARQSVSAGELTASGSRYAAAADGRTTFIVWSMKGSYGRARLGAGDYAGRYFPGGAFYLDTVAELAWELLVSPEFERLELEAGTKRIGELGLGMIYRREFELSGRPAREYSIRLEKERGTVYVCADAANAYVVAALGADAGDARLRRFADSFALNAASSGTGLDPAGRGDAVSPPPGTGTDGSGAATDYSQPFRVTEVTQKATLTGKPEPGFTEEARKFNVTGLVRLRAVLDASGEVRTISVIRGLPHGLTEKAIVASRGIRFRPAQKDGRTVSQWVILEYNFNFY